MRVKTHFSGARKPNNVIEGRSNRRCGLDITKNFHLH